MKQKKLCVFSLQLQGLILVSVLLTAATSFAAADTRRGFQLDEIAIGSGYADGHLKFTRATYKAVPAYLRFGFDMSSTVGMQESKGRLQLAFEPFCNPVTKPESGVESGLNVFFRYLHPLSASMKLVSEIGSGPMYLSIDSEEQGKAGFNFLNQFGLGAQLAVTGKSAITIGYRFRHLSNGGTSQPNRGINTNTAVISYSWLY
ncbi:MAG: acyloxyacyl hydrolase [Chlorobiaceae bacterium]|nr:acyloxyacyl hydrolase [Chlorobiaceae bacterium]